MRRNYVGFRREIVLSNASAGYSFGHNLFGNLVRLLQRFDNLAASEHWLDHVNEAHNCKLCLICHKLVGLGQQQNLDQIQKHVNTHISEDWLESVAAATGLNKNRFSSEQQCKVLRAKRKAAVGRTLEKVFSARARQSGLIRRAAGQLALVRY